MDDVRRKAQELADAIVESEEYKRFMAAKAQGGSPSASPRDTPGF